MEGQELIQLVLDFAREMNGLQDSFYPQIKAADGDKKQIFQQYRAQADQVYARYLTQRKRSCYYGVGPPFFGGVTENARFTVEQGKSRWTVEVLTREGMLDFQFSLVRRKGEVLIDSFRQRCRSPDRSRVDRWQYGSF